MSARPPDARRPSAGQKRPSKAIVTAALAVHVVVTVMTWRDLRGRTDAQVRGPKRLWYLASALNTSGSIAYGLVGRRRRRSS